MMALIRPDMYKKLKDDEEVVTHYEMGTVPTIVNEEGKEEFDIGYEEFKELARQRDELIKQAQKMPENDEFNPVSLEITEN